MRYWDVYYISHIYFMYLTHVWADLWAALIGAIKYSHPPAFVLSLPIVGMIYYKANHSYRSRTIAL